MIRSRRDIDIMPLKDLCAPLSARILPASARYSISGVEKSEGRIRETARRAGVDTRQSSTKWRKADNA